MILCQPHSFQVDVWSMAVCLLELLIQKPPLYGNTIVSMFHVATKGAREWGWGQAVLFV
jgi:hypothetical protein